MDVWKCSLGGGQALLMCSSMTLLSALNVIIVESLSPGMALQEIKLSIMYRSAERKRCLQEAGRAVKASERITLISPRGLGVTPTNMMFMETGTVSVAQFVPSCMTEVHISLY
ncbi:hypothetical protein NQZ68_008096 [Dissostichus eleginoides]|nr:hypothetical protein NQZ68_008096 [Dissostichus eleginoides]